MYLVASNIAIFDRFAGGRSGLDRGVCMLCVITVESGVCGGIDGSDVLDRL